MKIAKLFLATFVMFNSLISPVLAQGYIEQLELQRRLRDQQQLDLQFEMTYLNAQAAAEAERQESIRNLILMGGIIIAGSSAAFFYWKKQSQSKS